MDFIKDTWNKGWLGKFAVIFLGSVIALILLAIITPTPDDSGDPVAEAPAAADVASETEDAAPAEPTSEPEPTAVPPTEEPTAAPEPISLSGSGQTATDPVNIPFPMAVLTFSHNGQRNFIVQAFTDGGTDHLVNKIGPWNGQVLLPGEQEVFFDVNADGAWTIDIAPPSQADSAAFSGSGSMVSGLFDPPSDGPWEVSHDGERNFIVRLVCAGGTDHVQNEIGAVDGSTVVRFDRGPCMWVVEADGNWSLAPR